MKQPRSESEEIKADKASSTKYTAKANFTHSLSKCPWQENSNYSLLFFPNGRNLSIAEVKSNTLHLTVLVIHLQEINCQALKHFSSWVILGTFTDFVEGSQHFCLVFVLVAKHCSSFYVATFIYTFNNRIINFLLPLSWWPSFSLSSSRFLHVFYSF